MKVQSISLAVVILAAALVAPAAYAQRSGFIVGVAPNLQPRVQTQVQPHVQPLVTQPFAMQPYRQGYPTTPILPMTNPVQPFVNSPVQPFVQSPFFGYGASYGGNYGPPAPVIVVQPQPRTRYGRPDRDVTVIAPGGTVVIGSNPNQVRNQIPSNPSGSSSTFAYVGPPPVQQLPPVVIVQPETRTRPRVPPPVVGTPRADVMHWQGNPIGTVLSSGAETLYFDGGLVVVIQNGLVTQVR